MCTQKSASSVQEVLKCCTAGTVCVTHCNTTLAIRYLPLLSLPLFLFSSPSSPPLLISSPTLPLCSSYSITSISSSHPLSHSLIAFASLLHIPLLPPHPTHSSPQLTPGKALTAALKPSWRQTTCASKKPKPSSQMVPQLPFMKISTRPSGIPSVKFRPFSVMDSLTGYCVSEAGAVGQRSEDKGQRIKVRGQGLRIVNIQ